jgi:hypothetical protein
MNTAFLFQNIQMVLNHGSGTKIAPLHNIPDSWCISSFIDEALYEFKDVVSGFADPRLSHLGNSSWQVSIIINHTMSVTRAYQPPHAFVVAK